MPTDGDATSGLEIFAIYGFEIRIPSGWWIEINPKSARTKGDVVFHSPKNNRIYISWGPLDAAQKRFKTLEDFRNLAVANMKRAREVQSLSIAESTEGEIHGHRALMTRVGLTAGRVSRFARNQPVWKNSNSVHFYCPEMSRYYILYSLVNSTEEYSDFSDLFTQTAQSLMCHQDGTLQSSVFRE